MFGEIEAQQADGEFFRAQMNRRRRLLVRWLKPQLSATSQVLYCFVCFIGRIGFPRSNSPETGLKLFLVLTANMPVRLLLWYILRTEPASQSNILDAAVEQLFWFAICSLKFAGKSRWTRRRWNGSVLDTCSIWMKVLCSVGAYVIIESWQCVRGSCLTAAGSSSCSSSSSWYITCIASFSTRCGHFAAFRPKNSCRRLSRMVASLETLWNMKDKLKLYLKQSMNYERILIPVQPSDCCAGILRCTGAITGQCLLELADMLQEQHFQTELYRRQGKGTDVAVRDCALVLIVRFCSKQVSAGEKLTLQLVYAFARRFIVTGHAWHQSMWTDWPKWILNDCRCCISVVQAALANPDATSQVLGAWWPEIIGRTTLWSQMWCETGPSGSGFVLQCGQSGQTIFDDFWQARACCLDPGFSRPLKVGYWNLYNNCLCCLCLSQTGHESWIALSVSVALVTAGEELLVEDMPDWSEASVEAARSEFESVCVASAHSCKLGIFTMECKHRQTQTCVAAAKSLGRPKSFQTISVESMLNDLKQKHAARPGLPDLTSFCSAQFNRFQLCFLQERTGLQTEKATPATCVEPFSEEAPGCFERSALVLTESSLLQFESLVASLRTKREQAATSTFDKCPHSDTTALEAVEVDHTTRPSHVTHVMSCLAQHPALRQAKRGLWGWLLRPFEHGQRDNRQRCCSFAVLTPEKCVIATHTHRMLQPGAMLCSSHWQHWRSSPMQPPKRRERSNLTMRLWAASASNFRRGNGSGSVSTANMTRRMVMMMVMLPSRIGGRLGFAWSCHMSHVTHWNLTRL